MSWVMACEQSNIADFSMSRWSASGSRQELSKLKSEFEDKAVSFNIIDSSESLIITGKFHGTHKDRDWPLQSARLAAERTEIEPVQIEYSDGVKYLFDYGLNAIVEAQRSA